MKILYLITGLGLGGAEKVVVDLADQMYALGHSVKIAYLTGNVLVKPVSQDIEIIALNLDSVSGFLSASKKYRHLINRYKPDVVHAHMVHANIFARLNRIGIKVPKLICTAHSSNEGGKARMIAYRVTNSLSDINTNVSQRATDSLISKGAFTKSDLRTVYNGIDLSKFKRTIYNNHLNENVLNIITIGRFSDAKDYPNLIHAFALLKDDIKKSVRLTIVGDGELRSEIEELIRKLDLSDSVVLLGRRSDIPELLSEANIFVLASKYEGFGLVVAEAMACECYVVATDCGGVSEVMGDTGKLVPIQNSKALADSLKEAIGLEISEIIRNNEQAKARVEELFSLEASINTWLELYEKQ
ncbi:glycosyltransferase [Psychrobacter sp. H8-1]|uniref:glycosyltransferase n=1 Tax=Psychrobacter sp. H8-1 TaxID=2774129 RepID=UPI0019196D63|nr:glycosyltransferase [Psychrobacter sp. H8-1]